MKYDRKFNEVIKRLELHNKRFDEISERFNGVFAGIAGLRRSVGEVRKYTGLKATEKFYIINNLK